MRLPTIFTPKTSLSREDTRHGLHALTLECMASTGFSSITSSAFLVAFALALGANNLQIGILASIPWITDLFQIPAVWIVEKYRHRKLIVFSTWLISQLLWIPIALLPFYVMTPSSNGVFILIGLMVLRGILNAFSNCGWSSWMRDLIPRPILGRYFARRLSLATTVSIILGLGAAFFLNYWSETGGDLIGYSCVLLIGLVFFGLTSPVFTVFIPEPKMQRPTGPKASFMQTITSPLRERNYRQFMKFLMFWGFASNMALPFFEVFMLRELNLSILTVIILVTITEIFTAISLRSWGPLADRLGSKVVMSSSASLFLVVLMGWVILTTQSQSFILLPLLGAVHAIEGIAMAGILLAEEALSLKLAPQGKATSYTAGASLFDSIGTGIGLLTGGFLADFFDGHMLSLKLSGMNGIEFINPYDMQLNGFCILSLLSFAIGLVTLRTLHTVQEAGALRQETMLKSFIKITSFAYFKARTVIVVNQVIRFPVMYASHIQEKDTYNDSVADILLSPIPILIKDSINLKRGLQKKPPPRVDLGRDYISHACKPCQQLTEYSYNCIL